MTDSVAPEQKKSRRGLLALVGAGGAAAVAALLGRRNRAEALSGDEFLIGRSNDAETDKTSLQANRAGAVLHVTNNSAADFADSIYGETWGNKGWGLRGVSLGNQGVGVRGSSGYGWGTEGHSDYCFGVVGTAGTSADGLDVARLGVVGLGVDGGVVGQSGDSPGVYGHGKPGLYGSCHVDNGSGVRGDGLGPGTIGVFANNTPDRRALRTKGRVQMDTARKVTLSNRSNLVELPTGVQAGAFAIVLAMVQGAPGNEAFVRRAFRVDKTHIRITFNKKPASPTAVGYWVVQTG